MNNPRTMALVLLAALPLGCTSGGSEPEIGTIGLPVYDGVKALQEEIYSTVSVGGECTGTLIAPTVVLTAAHCFFDQSGAPTDVNFIRYGALDSGGGTQVATVVEAPHLDYNDQLTGELGSFNDIALVVVETAITDLPVAPVLPLDMFDQAVPPGTLVTVSGYGKTGDNEDNSELYIADTPYQERNGTELLAGGPGEPDTCPGDSGGPVYIDFEGTRYVTGATSRAAGPPGSSDCMDAGGIYTIPDVYDAFLRQDSDGAYPPPPPKPPETQDGSDDDGGCSIAAAGEHSSGGLTDMWLALGLAVVAARRRRR